MICTRRQFHRATALALLLTAAPAAVAAHGGWRQAVPESRINTTASEGCPIETEDGLSLLIASNRPGSVMLDIWAADRFSLRAPWTRPRNLGMPVNGEGNDFCPTPVRGRWLLFVSDRVVRGACGGGDIYLTRQSPAGRWRTPQVLGCAPYGPNFIGAERGPSLVETRHGTFLYYSSNGDGSDHDIYVSRMRPNGSFGPGRIIRRVSSEFDDFMPNVRQHSKGGFEMVFNSNRHTWGRRNWQAHGGQDVYVAVAAHPAGPWSVPHNLGWRVNTAGEETRPTLSGDGRRLHFGRDGDIYVSRR